MASAPRDDFARYYTEKLWALVPAQYRLDDAQGPNPGVLRAFIELLAARFADLRRSQDRLWDDQFIELCDEWAVPYIGDLVATRLISALDPRGRRVDVAKTLYYRRRKGTPRVLEELIDDIAGWTGKLVEEFRRLNRARYRLDPVIRGYEGVITGTAPGGWADLRSVRGGELAGTPFDEYFYTPDVRQARGRDGRYNIPKFTLHLYRLEAWPLVGVTPYARAGGTTFTIDPSGRDVPLFARNAPVPDYDQWHSRRPWELPAPIPCHLLGDAVYEVTSAAIAQLTLDQGLSLTAQQQLGSLVGERIPTTARLRRLIGAGAAALELQTPAVWYELMSLTLTAQCGRGALLWRSAGSPGSIAVIENGVAVPIERTDAGNLATWVAGPAPDARVLIDPVRGRLDFPNGGPTLPVTVNAYYGAIGAPGAGTYDRADSLGSPVMSHVAGGGAIAAAVYAGAGVVQIDDSATYGPVAAPPAAVRALTLQGADGTRAYLQLAGDLTLTGDVAVAATLTLEGLWIGASAAARVVLAGTFASVVVRHCTLDPGGTDADGNPLTPIALAIVGNIAQLTIDASIVGAVTLAGGAVDTLTVTDSIMQVVPETAAALALPETHATLRRTTILGGAQFDWLDASEVLCTGLVSVTDIQDGCFRYSAAATGSQLPHPYRSVALDDSSALFQSRRFGDPEFARLSEAAPEAVARGGEDTCEMGAFSAQHEQVRLDSLKVKVAEYMPFGLIPVYYFED
jgi:hypothetical protein